ncbi:MAG TPA: PEGA domain-containing protein [Labilithrix sp.]
MLSSANRCIAVVLTLSIVAPSVTLLAPRAAYAQAKRKPLREQLPEEAKKPWDAAVELYKHGNWDGARTSFLAAYDLSKNPRVLFNVAVCEKNMGRYARAIDFYKRELAEGKDLAPDEQAEVRTQITGLEQFVATLVIDVNEPGADVYVDDQKVGTSPLKDPVSVQLGERRIRASKPGFADAVETRDLKGGSSATVALKLTPAQRTTLVKVNVVGPPAADVYIDNKLVGPAPYTGQVSVQADPHQFSAQSPGWVSALQPAIVREGEPLTLTLQLAQEQAMGKLIVAVHPDGATIEIDGKAVGATKWEGPLSAETHQVVVKKTGYFDSAPLDVEVPKGSTRTVTVTLNEHRNTSFVPWLIGTVLVVGTASVASYFIFKPKDQEPVNGTLPPFTVGTPAMHFR